GGAAAWPRGSAARGGGAPPRRRRRRPVRGAAGSLPVALFAVSALCVATALAGSIARDAATAPVVLLVLTLGAATWLPWGIWPQLVLQVVATLAILWTVRHLDALATAGSMPVAVGVGAVARLCAADGPGGG